MHLLAVSIVQKVMTVETYWFWGIAYPLQVLREAPQVLEALLQ